jgi:outer membrane protein assembly factor BamB
MRTTRWWLWAMPAWLACGGGEAGRDDGGSVADHGVDADADGDAESGADGDADAEATEDVPVVPPVAGEWTQHAHDAQRTSFAAQGVPLPWRWKWAWNGPDAAGAVVAGKTSLPRGVQPVTGGGRVYVARGAGGLVALSETDGRELWTAAPGGELLATAAVDPDGRGAWVGSTDGRLYLLDAADGHVLGTFDAVAPIRVAPCLFDDRVVVGAGTQVVAVDRLTFGERWRYDAEAEVQTPASYSPSRDAVVVGAADLRVHAIDAASGARRWAARPTVHDGGEPYEYLHGWPVVAEAHGLVLVKLRLEWGALWTWNPWPTDNATIRANLAGRPDQQALFALDLDDGSSPFAVNVGHGGYGDGDYLPMGPQPVVKRFPDGTEVLYTVIRGDAHQDGRWDSHFGEVVLDGTTVPGLAAGDVRWIAYDYPPGVAETYLLTDEQPNVAMAGEVLLGGHWEAGLALRIVDRGPARGSYDAPVTSENAPTVVTSQDSAGCPFGAGHHCAAGLENTRVYSPGFYVYHGQGPVYDEYWSGYATWVVSNGTVYFRSCDGAVAALEAGEPEAKAAATPPPASAAVPVEPEAPSSGLETIDADDARAYAGRSVRVTGRLAQVFDNGKAVYLTFRRPHRGAFLARIPREAWSRFDDDPRRSFRAGQRVELTGRIGWYQGDPEIVLRDPAAVRILEDVR